MLVRHKHFLFYFRDYPCSIAVILTILTAFFLSGIFFSCKSDKNYTSEVALNDFAQAEQCKQRSSYDSAILFYNKSIYNDLRSSSWHSWSLGINGLIDCYRSKGEHAKASQELNKWDSVARLRGITLSPEYASLIHKHAVLYADKAEYSASDSCFNQAIRLRQKIGSRRDTAMALSFNGLGTNMLYQGKYDEALSYYMRAIGNYDSLGMKMTADYAMFSQNAGIIHAIQGNYTKAQEYFQLSLSINKEILNKNDPKLGLVYINIGRFFSLTGNDEKALELLTQAEDIYKLADSKSRNLSSIYLNIGAIYVNKANYEKALSYYKKALTLIQDSKTGNQTDLHTVLLNLGFIYEKKGDYQAANSYYLQSLQKGEKLQNSVKVLRGLANINFLLDNNIAATAYYEQALKSSYDLFGADNPETALTYSKYGEFCSLTGNNSKATEFMRRGLDFYVKAYGEKSRDAGNAYLFLANFYERTKAYDEALHFFQHALISSFSDFSDDDIFSNPKPAKKNLDYAQLKIVSGKASTLLAKYMSNPSAMEYLKASAETYSLAIQLMEALRSTYQEEDSKLMIAGTEKNMVLNAIKTQVEIYRKINDNKAFEKAFEYSEKGKSSVLLSYLRDNEAKNLGKIPEQLLKMDISLKSDLAFYNRLVFDESIKKDANQSKIDLWNTTLFELSRKHDSLIDVIEKNYPAYYNLKYDNSVIPITSVQKQLTEKQALIEYTLADSLLYMFVITRNESELYVSSLDTLFYHNLKVIREMLIGKSFNNYSPEDFRAFTHSSYQLYQVLLDPAKSQTQDKDLIIVPDADLGYLSFDILLTKPADAKAKGYRGLSYLIKQVPVSYAPSATALFEGLKDTEVVTNHKVLAFAPSYDNIKAIKVDELLRGRTYRDYLLPIPGAQEEVKILKKIFRSKVFDGEEATEKSFKKNARDFSILHLAMHTIINNENPMYSKLVFFHNSDTVEDGMLNTSELFGMKLNAELAVLSACNTGTGKLEQGEGIMSLSRGFFYAGVPSIIMTSWAVEDQSGALLMSSFYKYLEKGKPKNEALQLAKIEYLENTDQLKAHPHFWAAYMNIGDIQPIRNLKHPVAWYLYGIYALAGLILITATILYYRKRKRISS